jgi:DNA-binding NarL/FixJ family response regulator
VIRVLVVSRSPAVRAGFESMLLSDAELQVSSADFGALAGAPEFDVLVMDFDGRGEAALPAAGSVVALIEDPSRTGPVLRAGARAVLPRSAASVEIAAAVRAVAAGLVAVSPEALDALLSPAAPVPEAGPGGLTSREVEVLRMLAEGLANKTIAWRLGISEHTVKFHVGSIFSKLHAGSRTEAVAIGVRQGLVLL